MAALIENFGGGPQHAPDFKIHRILTEANDSGDLPITDKKKGINMGNYRHAIIDVFTAGGTNPTLEVCFWSEAAGAFLKVEPADIFTCDPPPSAGCQKIVEVVGRIMFVAINLGNTTAGNVTTISVAGFGLDTTL